MTCNINQTLKKTNVVSSQHLLEFRIIIRFLCLQFQLIASVLLIWSNIRFNINFIHLWICRRCCIFSSGAQLLALHEQIHFYIKYMLHILCKVQAVCLLNKWCVFISLQVWCQPWSGTCLCSLGRQLCSNHFLNYDHNPFLNLTKSFFL